MPTIKHLNGLNYRVRNTVRGRKVLISVGADGAVYVSKGARVSLGSVEKIMREKWDWVQSKIAEQKAKPQKILAHCSIKDFSENKERARELASGRLEHFNNFYKFNFKKVYIRNQKSRWGSCSGKGNLNFNYKIVFLPAELADYIIVHELCHLKEMNHSARFWALVAQQISDHKQKRKAIQLY
ncbi:M48 family metallopeptidase [Candidatus Nomurabacteria bacterium]|nr:M48 family metallopeptidase [Candidatus Nomurabacteria bacterium]